MILIPILVSITVVALVIFGIYILQNAYADYRNSFHTNIQNSLLEMFMFIPPQTLFILSIILLLIVFYVSFLLLDNYVIALLLAFATVGIPRFLMYRLKKWRIERLTRELPDFLLSISGAMKAGSSLSQSLEVAIEEGEGPASQEFSLIMREVRMGVDFSDALDNFSERVATEEAKLVTAAIKISREIGGNLSEAISRLSATLRTKQETEGKIKTLTAQGRLQGVVMTFLPIALGYIIYKMEPEAMMKLIEEPIGWIVLAVLFMMISTGYFFIRKIVNIDV